MHDISFNCCTESLHCLCPCLRNTSILQDKQGVCSGKPLIQGNPSMLTKDD